MKCTSLKAILHITGKKRRILYKTKNIIKRSSNEIFFCKHKLLNAQLFPYLAPTVLSVSLLCNCFELSSHIGIPGLTHRQPNPLSLTMYRLLDFHIFINNAIKTIFKLYFSLLKSYLPKHLTQIEFYLNSIDCLLPAKFASCFIELFLFFGIEILKEKYSEFFKQ